MFPSKTLLSFLLLSLSIVDASPVRPGGGKVSLQFSRRNAAGVTNIAEANRARAKAMREGTLTKRADAAVLINNALVSYTAQVSIGSPATDYTLLIDTGSSNTWIGAKNPYVATSTSRDTGNSVTVSYGSGSFKGKQYTDTVSLGNGLTITDQSIGVASSSTGVDVDGILGVGPTDLTQGTVANTDIVPTVVDNLFKQGVITSPILGVNFAPASAPITQGELTFGLPNDFVNYVPITSTHPANQYWGVDQSIRYGDDTSILSSTAGIVDTGSTLILIATDAFEKYKSATGAVMDSTTGLLSITAEQYENLKSLFFEIGGTTYELVPNAQIWPRSLNEQIGGAANGIYLVITDIGTPSGHGLDFMNGYTFLERFYSVYDTANQRVGLAKTEYTYSTTN